MEASRCPNLPTTITVTHYLQLQADIRISGHIILAEFGCARSSSCIRSDRSLSHDSRSYIVTNQRCSRPKVHLVSQKTFHPRRYLHSPRTLSERRSSPPFFHQTKFRTGDEIDAPDFTVLWVQIRFIKGVTHGPSPKSPSMDENYFYSV